MLGVAEVNENELAYYNSVLINIVNSFIEEAPKEKKRSDL
jgi:hypothetical protein